MTIVDTVQRYFDALDRRDYDEVETVLSDELESHPSRTVRRAGDSNP